MCATVTWAVIMSKTSGDMPDGENEGSVLCTRYVIWRPQTAHIALGSYYSLKRIKILFFHLQRVGRGREKTGKSINKIGRNLLTSPNNNNKMYIKIFYLSFIKVIQTHLIAHNIEPKNKGWTLAAKGSKNFF